MRTVLAALALLVAVPAAAADQPGTFGMAQRGSFKLVAGVLLSERGGEMKGVWLDAKQTCGGRSVSRSRSTWSTRTAQRRV